jgi:hypothetical protein
MLGGAEPAFTRSLRDLHAAPMAADRRRALTEVVAVDLHRIRLSPDRPPEPRVLPACPRWIRGGFALAAGLSGLGAVLVITAADGRGWVALAAGFVIYLSALVADDLRL